MVKHWKWKRKLQHTISEEIRESPRAFNLAKLLIENGSEMSNQQVLHNNSFNGFGTVSLFECIMPVINSRKIFSRGIYFNSSVLKESVCKCITILGNLHILFPQIYMKNENNSKILQEKHFQKRENTWLYTVLHNSDLFSCHKKFAHYIYIYE